MRVSLRRGVRITQCRWVRLTTILALAGVLSLTCTPICGSVLDTDLLSCCERHGCIPEGINTGPSANADCALMASRPSALCESVGFSADACCRMGELTYPAAQIRASGPRGFTSMIVVELIAAITFLQPVLHRGTQQTLSSASPPIAIPALQVTLRI
jgi:hypothetical protein